MVLVLRNTIFQFGYTYWIKSKRTAMGTQLAVFYAYVVMGHHEKQMVVQNTYTPDHPPLRQEATEKQHWDTLAGLSLEDKKRR